MTVLDVAGERAVIGPHRLNGRPADRHGEPPCDHAHDDSVERPNISAAGYSLCRPRLTACRSGGVSAPSGATRHAAAVGARPQAIIKNARFVLSNLTTGFCIVSGRI